MAILQDRSLRKPSGGRYKSTRPRRLAQTGSNPSLTTVGQKRVRKKTIRGGHKKKGLLSIDVVNLFDSKTGKHSKVKIKTVKEVKANTNYVRRNIITKGSIIETEKGLAIITNRPGQEGHINATLKQ